MKIKVKDNDYGESIEFERHGNTLFTKEAVEELRGTE